VAFASMVVSEKHPIRNCPHLTAAVVACEKELAEQYAAGKWLKRDMKADALAMAREKSVDIRIEDLPARIGGRLVEADGKPALAFPYFNGHILIDADNIAKKDGTALTRYEQVFIYIHLARGGSSPPSGKWRNLVEIFNTGSKVKSMVEHVEKPLIEKFQGNSKALRQAALKIGGLDKQAEFPESDVAIMFSPLPQVPVMHIFWDGEAADGFGAEVKLSFDDTITQHLDIEAIMFLSERLRDMLFEKNEKKWTF
jgi:hypothetical protein